MKIAAALFALLALPLAQPFQATGQDLEKQQPQIVEYKQWLDILGPNGVQFWNRVDTRRRPHRLYLGDEFFRADFEMQKWFVEIFSSYLAGHPERAVIVDLFDATTNKLVGEYGWAGFRLYADADQITERVRRKVTR